MPFDRPLLLGASALLTLSACSNPGTATSPVTAPALDEASVRAFAEEWHAGLVGYEEGLETWKSGLTDESSYFNAGFGAPQRVALDAARAEMFWEDSVTCNVKDVKVYTDCASVYGSVIYEDLGMRWRKVFHGTVVERDGRLVWDRWMECADPLLANRYAGWTSESAEAGAEYVSMAWNIINGEFSTARAQTPKILALDPGMATAHLGTAWAAWVDGDDEAAQAAMDAAVAALDDEGEAQQLMVRALATEDADEALGLLEKALVIAPDDPLLAVNYTVALGLRKEDPAGAARFLRRVLRRWPNVGGLHNMMGYMLMAQDDLEGAERHFKMYMRLQPNTANAYDSMGDFLRATGKPEEAKAMYQRTLELDPDFKAARTKLDALS